MRGRSGENSNAPSVGKRLSRAMIPSPLKAKNLEIATLTILLQECRNAMNAMFLLLAKSDKAAEAMEKFGHLEPLAKSALKTGTDT